MTERRLYIGERLTAGISLTLDPDRSHYLCRVLRQRRGDHVLLFCGDGDAYEAEICNADSRACEVRVGPVAKSEPTPRVRLHLAQALLKGDRLDFVMQKATELGATDIWLIDTERTEVRFDGPRAGRRELHWQRVLASAAEQCGRLRLPTLHAPAPLPTLLDQPRAVQTFLLDPGAPPVDRALACVDTMVLVGPEGGFSDVERSSALAYGAYPIGLGELILRADTAPLAALAIVRQAWGWRVP